MTIGNGLTNIVLMLAYLMLMSKHLGSQSGKLLICFEQLSTLIYLLQGAFTFPAPVKMSAEVM